MQVLFSSSGSSGNLLLSANALAWATLKPLVDGLGGTCRVELTPFGNLGDLGCEVTLTPIACDTAKLVNDWMEAVSLSKPPFKGMLTQLRFAVKTWLGNRATVVNIRPID